MIPNSTTLPDITLEMTSSSPTDIEGTTMSEFMWIPYVVLGGILILLAVASFVHYHVQNRGRYEEQKFKAKAGLENGLGNRKYRVTLNINGTPYSVGKAPLEATTQYSPAKTNSLPPVARNIDLQHNSVLPPIGGQENVANRKYVRHEDSNDTLSSKERSNHQTGSSSPDAQCSYINEAFDSSGDSERSLISREMLKKQKKVERYRQSSSQMETLSSDLELDDKATEPAENYKDNSSKPRRKTTKTKYSSG